MFSNARMNRFLGLLLCLTLGCAATSVQSESDAPFVLVLGVAQDGGYPQAGCEKPHCARAHKDPSLKRFVSSLAIIDPSSGERWIVDATPDFRDQLHLLESIVPARTVATIDGILLTHAHIGHYTGLMQLGREVIGAKKIRVYAMPRMADFLRNNGPWDQLVNLENIQIHPLVAETTVHLNERISVTPFLVPHRDEYSETVGFLIKGPSRSLLYIPDIDKWERWTVPIEDMLSRVDAALLDGTFYADGELSGRSMAEIPHPFIVETMARFRTLPDSERAKVHFIHLNHSNPALDPESEASGVIARSGCHVVEQGSRFAF